MDLEHGLLMFIFGCTITIIGFFIAFLVINYNKKKEEERIKRQNEKKIHPYGDDTVWQNQNIHKQRTGIETLEQ